MAFYSIDDPEFWGRDTQGMEEIAAKGGMEGISIANFVLGKREDNSAAATVLRMAPGYVLPHHAHDCHRLEVVIQGSITVGDGKVLTPGCIMFSEPGNFYGPHVAGSEGCTTIEIFSNFDASHKTLMKDSSGVVECDLWSAEGAQRMMELVLQQMPGRTA